MGGGEHNELWLGHVTFSHLSVCSEVSPETYVGGIMSPHFIMDVERPVSPAEL